MKIKLACDQGHETFLTVEGNNDRFYLHNLCELLVMGCDTAGGCQWSDESTEDHVCGADVEGELIEEEDLPDPVTLVPSGSDDDDDDEGHPV